MSAPIANSVRTKPRRNETITRRSTSVVDVSMLISSSKQSMWTNKQYDRHWQEDHEVGEFGEEPASHRIDDANDQTSDDRAFHAPEAAHNHDHQNRSEERRVGKESTDRSTPHTD